MKLQELLDRFGQVTQRADGWLAHCPAHSDAQASLRIALTSEGKALLKCRAGCETASVLQAVGLSFHDLSNIEGASEVMISDRRKDALPIEEIARLRVQLDHYTQSLSESAYAYAAERFGLTVADCDRLNLGAAYDLPGGERLVVPFANPDGVALGFQARALEADAAVRWYGPRNPEVGAWSRLGFFSATSGWSEVVITEGPGDALTAVGAGYDAIAIRGAGLASDALAREILEWVPDRPLVLAGDGDNAGRTFSSTLATALSNLGASVRVLDLPDSMDLTDWRKQSVERFAGALVQAVSSAKVLSSTAAALRQRDENRYPLTDLGNARFVADLAAAQGTSLRYVEEMGFLILTNGVWTEDRLERSRSLVHEAADLVRQIADELMIAANVSGNQQQQADARRWVTWAKYCQSRRGIDSVLSEIKALPPVATRIEDLDRHHHLLAVRNGVVDLRAGVLMPHDPLLLLTQRVDLDFNPQAQAPRWEKFLREVMRDDLSMVDYLHRLVGYSITGETSEQCFTVLWGSGANGKTVFTATLSDVFGPISVTTPFSTFEAKGNSGGIPNDLAALRSARLVFASEGEADKPMAEALLKRLTGRDPVTARFLRKEFFTFRPVMQLFLATNNKPSFRGADEGLWRRVKLVEWARYFAPDERDHKLPDRLLLEAEGILAWAVRGAALWYRLGLSDPAPIIDAAKEYRATSDVLAGFLPGMFIPDPHAKRILGKDLFDGYLQWADEENLKPNEIVRRTKFYSMLEERGYIRHSVNTGIAFNGIRRARPSDGFPQADHVESVADSLPLRAAGSLSLEDV